MLPIPKRFAIVLHMTTIDSKYRYFSLYPNIADELVAILQRTHPKWTWGSDRIANANAFVRANAAELVNFTHTELHPESCELYRNMAKGAA